MIPMHEAQRKLIMSGFTVNMQSPYRNLTILNSRYEDVKRFLIESGYEGDIIVIQKKHGRSDNALDEKQ